MKALYSSFLILALVLTLSGCSADEDLSPGADAGNKIRFAASSEYTKAPDITTNNLTEFNVYAYLDGTSADGGTPYMDNVVVTKNDHNSWTYSPTAYWPSSGSLSFYAFAPSFWVTGSPLKAVEWDNMTSKTGLPATTDLVYAVSPKLSGNYPSPNAQVVFNFRHALAKVTVRMSSSNPNLRVQVSNVVLAGIKSKGNFMFPHGNTALPNGTSTEGTWSGQNSPVPIALHFAQSPDDVINLTTTPTDMGDVGLGIGGAKFMIPQLLSWRSNGMGSDTYISVMCSVYDADTNVKLWPNENTPEDNVVAGSTYGDGLLKFPLSTSSFSDWKAGFHYIYNLVINSNEEMGQIDFGNPTVDTYVEVNTTYQ